MFLLRLVGKVMLIPVWILVAIAWIFVKAAVSIYSFARGFVVFGLGVLIVGTLLCYHDWKQSLLLLSLSVMTLIILFVCITIEMLLEKAVQVVGNYIV